MDSAPLAPRNGEIWSVAERPRRRPLATGGDAAHNAAMTDASEPALSVSDREVYLKLSAVAEELMRLAEAAESYVGNAALTSAANTLSGTARVIYEHCLGGEDEVH